MLTPKRWKYRKPIIRSLKGKSTRGTSVSFGDYGLKAITSGYISNKQIEAARKVIVRHIRKVGKIWVRIFPDTPFTKKGLEMPMGTGKGDVDIYTAPVRKGKILFEISGLDEEEAKKVLISASKKLPVKARVVAKGEIR
ncbi:MAG: 50S ribosomal protein L16 [Candidatus Absconditabacteria bacterium]|nr:50S ribosomal protein L16 [Candidatus Absconditabacteria bacterium]